jgi:hypothetical protein
MTRRRQGRGEKGYFYEIGGKIGCLLCSLGTWQPTTSNAIGSCLVSVAEMELRENALHVVLDGMLTDYETLSNLSVREARCH